VKKETVNKKSWSSIYAAHNGDPLLHRPFVISSSATTASDTITTARGGHGSV